MNVKVNPGRETWINIAVLILVLAAIGMFFKFSSGNLERHSVWLDEARTAEIARGGTYAEVSRQAISSRPYPPLYFLIVHESMKVWDNEKGLRFPSVVFGALTILGTFLFARALFGNLTGLAAVVLVATIPKFFFHMRDGNCYTMLSAMTVLSSYFIFQAFRSGRPAFWAAYVITASAAIGTHMFGLFYVMGQGLGYLVLAGGGREFFSGLAGIKSWCARNRAFLTSMTVLGLLLGAWLIIYKMLGHVKPARDISLLSAEGLKLAFSSAVAAFMKKNYMVYMLKPVMIPLQIFGLAACFVWNRKNTLFLLLLAAVPFLMIPIALELVHPMRVTRYTVGIAPLFATFTAGSVLAGLYLMRRFRNPAFKMAGLGVVAVCLFLLGQHAWTYGKILPMMRQMGGSEYWREASKILTENANTDDVVFIAAGHMESPLNFYYEGNVKQVTFPGGQADEKALREKILQNLIGKNRIWLILSHVNEDEPLERILNEFRATLPLNDGRTLLIAAVRAAEQKLPGIKLILYQVGGTQLAAKTPAE